MRAEIESMGGLRFDDGSPVRAASAVARLSDGWLVAQDDVTSAAWWRQSSVVAVRVLPPVDGHDVFSAAAGTKHLKPDFEAACELTVDGAPAVLLLGSGSGAARMRASLVRLGGSGPRFDVVALDPLYDRVAAALGVTADELNLEGACRLGDRLRWFSRGNLAAGVPSTSVDVDLAGLLAAVGAGGGIDPAGSDLAGIDPAGVDPAGGDPAGVDRALAAIRVDNPLQYELGAVDGVGLAVTDAVALPDGRVLLSAAAEDTPNAVDDGPVVGAALALVHEDELLAVAPLAAADGTVHKVEGLALREVTRGGVRLLAVVDADDPLVPSTGLTVRVDW